MSVVLRSAQWITTIPLLAQLSVNHIFFLVFSSESPDRLFVVFSLFDRRPSRPAGPMGKRKRRKLSGSEDADSQQPQLSISAPAGHGWTPKHLGDLKAYNKKAVEKPGEVSRTAVRPWRGAGTVGGAGRPPAALAGAWGGIGGAGSACCIIPSESSAAAGKNARHTIGDD